MFENKKIIVLGLARSGIAASKFLKKRGCDVTVNDRVSSYDKAVLDELDSLDKLPFRLTCFCIVSHAIQTSPHLGNLPFFPTNFFNFS